MTDFKCEICGRVVEDTYRTVDFEEDLQLEYRYEACSKCYLHILATIKKERCFWAEEK